MQPSVFMVPVKNVEAMEPDMNEPRQEDEAERLSVGFMATGALPPRAQSDAAHLAIATAVNADYLLTWNCRHLANAQILRRLEREAQKHGWKLPKVCTPPELMGDLDDENEPNS